jgi:hypothetical protein
MTQIPQPVICPRCGQTNAIGRTECWNCKLQLSRSGPPNSNLTANSTAKFSWWNIIGALSCLVICVGLVIIWGSISGNEQPEAPHTPDATEAYVMSQDFVSQRLKAPSTASFPWISEATVTDQGLGEFTVTAYVDAENSFGAKLRQHYSCRMVYLGNDQWKCENLSLY